MAPALHPRSRQTVSLFTGTLLVSFFVVGLPHLLPCPVPSHAYADAPSSADPNNPQRRRRRRTAPPSAADDDNNAPTTTGAMDAVMEDGRRARECPVPKPGGLIGKVLGFDTEGGARPRPTEVVVESTRARRERGKGGDQERS